MGFGRQHDSDQDYKGPDIRHKLCRSGELRRRRRPRTYQLRRLRDIDFSDTNITVTTIRNAGINAVAFDGLHFFDVFGAIPSFTSVTLNAATNYGGLTSSNISFDANNIYVNVANLPGLSGQVISLDVSANGTSGSSRAGNLGVGWVSDCRRRAGAEPEKAVRRYWRR